MGGTNGGTNAIFPPHHLQKLICNNSLHLSLCILKIDMSIMIHGNAYLGMAHYILKTLWIHTALSLIFYYKNITGFFKGKRTAGGHMVDTWGTCGGHFLLLRENLYLLLKTLFSAILRSVAKAKPAKPISQAPARRTTSQRDV